MVKFCADQLLVSSDVNWLNSATRSPDIIIIISDFYKCLRARVEVNPDDMHFIITENVFNSSNLFVWVKDVTFIARPSYSSSVRFAITEFDSKCSNTMAFIPVDRLDAQIVNIWTAAIVKRFLYRNLHRVFKLNAWVFAYNFFAPSYSFGSRLVWGLSLLLCLNLLGKRLFTGNIDAFFLSLSLLELICLCLLASKN